MLSDTQREHTGEVEKPVMMTDSGEGEALGEPWPSFSVFALPGLVPNIFHAQFRSHVSFKKFRLH